MSTLVIFSLGCLTPGFIQAEAMRKTSSYPSIVELPGRDGCDGQLGRDGRAAFLDQQSVTATN